MKEALDKKALTAMLLGAVEKIRENHSRLSELDSYGGDGDHGTTMLRAMENLNTSVGGSGDANIEKLLGDAAWAVIDCTSLASAAVIALPSRRSSTLAPASVVASIMNS